MNFLSTFFLTTYLWTSSPPLLKLKFGLKMIRKCNNAITILDRFLTFGMKIKDMVTVAGNIIHTLKAAYNCSY